MCGILGIIHKSKQLSEEDISVPLSAIAHRGPDDSGIYLENNIGLAHQRLSIVDLSPNGHQPMISKEGNYILVFNGEIYNHSEIRQKLQKEGYTFKGTSDTETLLYGYIQYGKEVLNMLNGIFAFAIYDKTKKQVFIARDQFGVKPLYYYASNNTFAFSSEIKSLIYVDDFNSDIDYEALVDYINFLWCPGEKTPFGKVKKVLPGYCLTYDLTTFTFKAERYYDIPFTGNYFNNKTEEELIAELDQKLISAVERQLMSDVPLGFFVSGGLDSSLIAAIAQKVSSTKINAFTIDPGESMKKEGFAYDLDYAVSLSKSLGFDLNIINSRVDILEDFDKMIWHLDEPQADPAPLSVYNISREARRKGIKVLLGGSGGDELFSGYRRHQALYYNRLIIDKIPLRISKLLKKGVDNTNSKSPFNRRLKKILGDVGVSNDVRMANYFSWLPLSTNKGLFADNILHTINAYNPNDYLLDTLHNISTKEDDLNRMLYLEMKSYLPDHNFNYTDKMSMAVSVEARVPYLDVDLVNFSTGIPPGLKMKGTTTKYLLRKVAEKYLPKDIIYRPKTGFGAPVRDWVVNDMKDMIGERLSPSRIDSRGIFNSQAVQKLIEDNKKKSIDASYSIWSLLAIESWMEQFVDKKAATTIKSNKINNVLAIV